MEREPRHLVVLGASAGGPLALGDILAALPHDLDAAVVVVLHLMAGHPSLLANVLQRRTNLEVTQARDGEALAAGRVYVAPPDAHLTFAADRTVRLDPAPPRRHHRPSLDTTFESAADAFDRDTIAVVLTGTGNDGAEGVLRVHERGGLVLVQDDAEFDAMPTAAVATGAVDRVLPLGAIAPAIAELTAAPA
jgi:two-component system chemotaxis response regulator CheB